MSQAFSSSASHDVLVAGGGPIGLTLALALAQKDFRVAVIDARDLRMPAAPEPRGWLAVHACWRIFEALGLGGALAAHAQPVERLENRAGGGLIGFDSADAGEAPALGHMVEAVHLMDVLLAAARAEQRIAIASPVRIANVRFDDPVAVIDTDGGTFRAPLIAACDGVRSTVRAAAGLRFEGRDYALKAVSAFMSLARPHEGIARQVFVREGPMAVLPLRGQRANLVWSVPSAIANALVAMPAADFEAELARAGEGLIAGARLEGAPAAFPLGLHLAERFHGRRLALVGDSAHQVHPLAGQGLNLGLKDVAALVDVVIEAMQLGLDVGSPIQLEGYTRWRRPDAVGTAAAMEGFVHAFAGPAPVRALAGWAMGLAGQFSPARSWFARTAGGATGELPSLMRLVKPPGAL